MLPYRAKIIFTSSTAPTFNDVIVQMVSNWIPVGGTKLNTDWPNVVNGSAKLMILAIAINTPKGNDGEAALKMKDFVLSDRNNANPVTVL